MWPFRKKSNLKAAKWAEHAVKKNGPANPESLFVGLMYVITRMERPAKGLEFSEAAIFELGCYVLSAIDIWIFYNRPSSRERVMNVLMCRYSELYQQIFQMDFDEILSIIAQRQCGYGEIFRSAGMDIERILPELTQMMLFSEPNGKPCPYELGKGPVELDFFKTSNVGISIIVWHKNVFPVLINATENLCDEMK